MYVQREDVKFLNGICTDHGIGKITGKWLYKQYEGQESLLDTHADLQPSIQDLREIKRTEIKASWAQQMRAGSIQSQALGIEIDARRNDTDNDLQNIEVLIKGMIATNTPTCDYVGKTQVAKNVTVAQLQAASLEMAQYALVQLYEKKHGKDAQIEAATTKADLDKIVW